MPPDLWHIVRSPPPPGFLSGFGPRGGKMAICDVVGGIALTTCIALGNVAESGGILKPSPPPNFEPFFSEHLVQFQA